MQIRGFIESIPSPIATKYKWPNGDQKFMFSMVVDGTRYSTKSKDMSKLEGKYVEFEAEQSGEYWNADPSTVKEIPAPTKGPSKSNGAVAPSTATANDRQDSIIYQSSRKDAIEMVNAMLTAGLIDFGKAKGAQKMELYEVYVDHYTVRLFDDTKRLAPPQHADPRDAELPEAASSIARPARKAKPAEQDNDFADDDIPF